MNGKNLQELWERGTDRLSGIFRLRPASNPGAAVQQFQAGHLSLIAATARPGQPDDILAGFVGKIIENDKSAIILRAQDPAVADIHRNPSVIEIESPGDRAVAYAKVSMALTGRQIDRILGIPRSAGDLLNAIAASDITAAQLAVWITKDYDFHTDSFKSELLDEALRKARVCFAASESLRADIQKRFGKKIWIIPALNSHPDPDEERPSEVPSPELSKELPEWIWKSLAAGAPMDDRFEQLSAPLRDRLAPYVDPPAPTELHWEMKPHFQALDRLRAAGYHPDFVVDVGASTGYWSHIATKIFPSSRYFLIEPLLEKYLQAEAAIYQLHPEFVKIEAAAGNVAGELEMNVSPDLYGSSFFDFSASSGRPVRIRVRTLDEIALGEGIQGRGLLKIDVQFSEHLVLEGSIEFLKQVDVIFVEVSLRRFVPVCKTFLEILNQLHGLGFEYRDYAGTWRDPATGELLQQDAIFARQIF
jgi:FkbM family methyltransferase